LEKPPAKKKKTSPASRAGLVDNLREKPYRLLPFLFVK
jgi:hypothetical protein